MPNWQNLIIILAVSFCLVNSCATHPRTPSPAAPLEVESTPEVAFQTALEVLGRMHFHIAQADANLYFIRTHPLSGGQWFELWRQDNASAAAFTEANLNSIRRSVEVQIRPQPPHTIVSCQVRTQRLSVPPLAVNSSSQTYRLLTDSEPLGQRLAFTPEQEAAMAWIDLGDDPPLAHRILKRIEKQLVQ